MQLKLNNKLFEGKFDGAYTVIIPLNDDYDKYFFIKWQDKSKNSSYKKDFIKDVDVIKVAENGTLKNCFPLLSPSEDFVRLVYDSYIITKRLDEV